MVEVQEVQRCEWIWSLENNQSSIQATVFGAASARKYVKHIPS